MVQLNFNAADVAPATGFEPLPNGKYLVIAEASEQKDTKANNGGTYLQFTFQVIEGAFSNRKVWARINNKNPNDVCQKIGLSELSALCRAVGVLNPQDTSDLHNRPLLISVECEKRKDTGAMSNVIKKYESADGALVGAAAAPAAPSAAKPAATTPPWLAKK